MARAVRRSSIAPLLASFPVKCKAPDGSSVFEATSFFVSGDPAMRPHDPYGINSFGGFLATTVKYVAGSSLLSGVEAFADNVSVLSSLSFTLTTRFGGYLVHRHVAKEDASLLRIVETGAKFHHRAFPTTRRAYKSRQ